MDSMHCSPQFKCLEAFRSLQSQSARLARRTRAISPRRFWRSTILLCPHAFAPIANPMPKRSENRMRDSRNSAANEADSPPRSNESFHLGIAAQLLRNGGVVAHATEGVWGLACDPFNGDAVARVLELKGRSIRKGLIVIGADPFNFVPELAM